MTNAEITAFNLHQYKLIYVLESYPFFRQEGIVLIESQPPLSLSCFTLQSAFLLKKILGQKVKPQQLR